MKVDENWKVKNPKLAQAPVVLHIVLPFLRLGSVVKDTHLNVSRGHFVKVSPPPGPRRQKGTTMPCLQAYEPQISGFNIVSFDGLDGRSTVNCAFVSCLASWRMKLMPLPLQAYDADRAHSPEAMKLRAKGMPRSPSVCHFWSKSGRRKMSLRFEF